MVHGMVMVHNNTSTVHQVGHMSTTSSQVNYINLINCINCIQYTPGMKKKNKEKPVSIMGFS